MIAESHDSRTTISSTYEDRLFDSLQSAIFVKSDGRWYDGRTL